METTTGRALLATKMFIPPVRNGLVVRARLTQRFAHSQSRKLTLISAPAGFGKTTLSSYWLTQQTTSAAWVSLDKTDNDPVLFFSYILTALQQINAQIVQNGLDILHASTLPNYQTLIISLVNDIIKIDEQIILVLDDYHLIEAQKIHDALTLLIENQPPQLHLALISRTEPPLPIAKLRAKNQLVEINAQDLRFTQSEAEQFLNELMRLNLSLDDVAELEKHTEGWITGLQLTALSLRNAPSAEALLTHISGDDRFIVDYLIDEVLSMQSEEIQQFLLNTSILHQLNADLCNQLLQIHNSQAILETLEKSNLFVISLDKYRHWYRYHHLFAEMLQSRLHLQFPETVIQLYERAFDWHMQNDMLEDAVGYALQGKLYDQAADLVEEIGQDVYWQNRANTMQEWLDALPDRYHQTRPNLRLLSAYSQIDKGDMLGVEQTVNKLEFDLQQHPFATPDEQRLVEGKLAAIKTAVVYHRYLDGNQGYQLARQALDILPLKYTYERIVATFHCGGSLVLVGELNEARTYLQEALTLCDIAHNPLARLLTLSNLGYLEMVAGALQKANSYFQEAYQFAHQIDVRQGSTFSGAVSGLANLYYEWNELDTAERYIREGIQIVEEGEFLDRRLLAYRVLFRIQVSRRNFAEAHEIVKQARQFAAACHAPAKVKDRIESLAIYISLAEGDLTKAAIWVAQFKPDFPNSVSYELEFELLLLCKFLIAQQDYVSAVDWLDKLLELAQRQARGRSIIRIRILLAKVYSLRGEQAQAIDNLKKALLLAEPEGFIRPFLNPGEPIRALLLEMQQGESEKTAVSPSRTYIQQLLDAFSAEQPSPLPVKIGREQFTARELDVLVALAEGLSYAAIGDKLAISENTVRTHIKSIYSKFDAHNRTQVLLKAQATGLI